LFTHVYKKGIKWPFLFSVAMLVFALLPFAALSSILADLGYAIFEPRVPRGEFWRLQDLYLWHFMSSVPGLKIPETLLWPEPFRYKDHLSGVLLLAFKIIVIVPVIASFTVGLGSARTIMRANRKAPNIRVGLTAQQRCCWVPSALSARAARALNLRLN
jgi:hypothetical protein